MTKREMTKREMTRKLLGTFGLAAALMLYLMGTQQTEFIYALF